MRDRPSGQTNRQTDTNHDRNICKFCQVINLHGSNEGQRNNLPMYMHFSQCLYSVWEFLPHSHCTIAAIYITCIKRCIINSHIFCRYGVNMGTLGIKWATHSATYIPAQTRRSINEWDIFSILSISGHTQAHIQTPSHTNEFCLHVSLLKLSPNSSPLDKMPTIRAVDSFIHFFNENNMITCPISLKLATPNNNKPTLVQVMAWRPTGDTPLPESIMNQFTDA